MKHIHSYSKVYNLGHEAIKTLFEDEVLVEEKIDGSTFGFGVFDDELCCRSHGKDIVIDNPEKMFNKAINTIREIKNKLHPEWLYWSEYLRTPKHNTLCYERIPKDNLIIFDIDIGDQKYLNYIEKELETKRIGLEVVPVIRIEKIKKIENIMKYLELDSYLGNTKIEGIVIKNYKQFTRDGKTMMGKYVSEKFKEVHNKRWKKDNPSGLDFIMSIAEEYQTEARWEKSIQHLCEDGLLTNSPADIGNLMKYVSKDVLEECKDGIKEKLFKYAWSKISRKLCGGLPEWYKKKLAEKQFENK
jgi:hypothetical protein